MLKFAFVALESLPGSFSFPADPFARTLVTYILSRQPKIELEVGDVPSTTTPQTHSSLLLLPPLLLSPDI
jgi:hypothetical protein